MRSEQGQAAIEWVGLVLLAALVLGAAGALAGRSIDGRSYGGFIAHRMVCAVRGGCEDGGRALERAYGARGAELLRRHAPGIVYEPGERELPVDWRSCRSAACANAPDDRALDSHRTDSGRRATAYTRVIRRHGRTYLQYWLYYPDSNSTFAGSDKLWRALQSPLGMRPTARYPGFHLDDWEGFQVRIDRRGTVAVRASSHGHYQWCKQRRCRGRWGAPTGWTRVSRGSHAGHIPLERRRAGIRGVRSPRARRGYRPRLPGRDMRERTTTAEGLRLVPLESIDRRRYRRLAPGVSPPWQKRVYRNPEDDGS